VDVQLKQVQAEYAVLTKFLHSSFGEVGVIESNDAVRISETKVDFLQELD
jgi:hypothetical protein